MGEKMYEVFKYDKKNSYFNNFYNWWALDCEEKRGFGQKPYTDEEAIAKFNQYYGHYNK
tara:strand:- start:2694 stop:2870 length:177 start_codon:yes stop_codon:yes gene_type:complete